MPNKLLMIGAAVSIAAAVLLLAIWAGGPSTAGDEAPQAFPSEDEVFIAGPNAEGQLPLGESGRFNYESWENGRLTRFGGERIIPKPRGVAEVTDPTVQVQLGPGKELTITADQATVVAPDNHPREGEMRGNVIVTLYETPDGSPVDFDSDRDIVIRTYFDAPVQFDLQLQQLDSEGPILLTGPEMEIRGRGLSLNYNELRHRIERLVIKHGESIRYFPNAKPKQSQAPESTRHVRPRRAAKPTPTTTAEHTTQPDVDTSSDTGAASAVDAPRQVRPTQFYFVRFEDVRDIQIGGGRYELEGNELEAVFGAKDAGGTDEPVEPGMSIDDGSEAGHVPPATQESTPRAAGEPSRSPQPHATASSTGPAPASDERSLSGLGDEQVVILWTGQLTVVPLSAIPEELAGPDDAMVTIIGSPARVRTDSGETIVAPRVSFLDQDARLFAEGSDAFPVTVDSAELGLLTGRELSINQRLATGYVLGPGTLTGLISDDDALNGEQAHTQPTDLTPIPDTRTPTPEPARMTVAWERRLDLVFYPKMPEDKADPQGTSAMSGAKIKGLKSARFAGGITVDHPDLNLQSDRLTLDLAEDPPKGDDKLAIELITATGNVRVAIKEQDARLTADRLLVRPGEQGESGGAGGDQLELFGLPDAPAQVIRPDASLVGNHIVMDQKAGSVHVKGPGSIDFLQDVNDPGKTVHVTWRDSMRYNDTTGAARFLGDVKTRSTDGADTNELMGEDLSMTFVADDSKSEDDTQDTADRRLATAIMQKNARFRARSYETDNHEQLLTELYMVGPVMKFDDPGVLGNDSKAKADDDAATLQVQVVGEGRMLITDSRPQASEPKRRDAKPDAIQIAGRGKTAFQWSDRLVLDLTHGDMVMKGQVAMVHQPDKGDRVQLDCLDLAAELKSPDEKKKRTGGGGWLSDDAPQPELQRVWADGGIRIIHGPVTVHSDHLLYEESKREILLWADDRNEVTYQVEGQPNLTKSSAFKWHRDTGRFEAFRLRTGTIPLRRSERRTDKYKD